MSATSAKQQAGCGPCRAGAPAAAEKKKPRMRRSRTARLPRLAPPPHGLISCAHQTVHRRGRTWGRRLNRSVRAFREVPGRVPCCIALSPAYTFYCSRPRPARDFWWESHTESTNDTPWRLLSDPWPRRFVDARAICQRRALCRNGQPIRYRRRLLKYPCLWWMHCIVGCVGLVFFPYSLRYLGRPDLCLRLSHLVQTRWQCRQQFLDS